MTTKYTKSQIDDSRAFLLKTLRPGDTVHCILKHVSCSGMYRVIDFIVVKDDQPINISWAAAMLLEGFDPRWDGCRASGCGMDMGFHLVYNLGYKLWPEGFQCVGKDCAANDHSNPPYPRRDGIEIHNDSGYALNYHWL